MNIPAYPNDKLKDLFSLALKRNNFTDISETLHAENKPVFLTKNGVGDMVVMSMEYYDECMTKLEVYAKLAQAQKEIAEGAKGKDAIEFIKSLRKNYE